MIKTETQVRIEKQCSNIKLLVEEFSGVKNIGIDSNKRILSDFKKIYCKLCKIYTDASFETIGFILREGYNHASVIHSIKKFDQLKQTRQLSGIKIFDSVASVLDKLKVKNEEAEENKPSELIHEYTAFLNWFRNQANKAEQIESSFFVGKYFSEINKE